MVNLAGFPFVCGRTNASAKWIAGYEVVGEIGEVIFNIFDLVVSTNVQFTFV